jgi:hypothetical protein
MGKSIALVIIDTYDQDFFTRYAIERSVQLQAITAVYAFHKGEPIAGAKNYKINKLKSLSSYSDFVINTLPYFVEEDYCLIIQWDGFVVGPSAWTDEFLEVDYVGAPWPASMGGNLVGNGGFSLRSKKFMSASKGLGAIPDPNTYQGSAEDVILCRTHYDKMIQAGLVYATPSQAAQFSFEDTPLPKTLGFHGPFNLPRFVDEHLLCENLEEIIVRVSNNLIMGKLILTAVYEQKHEFATALINRIRQDRTRVGHISRVFERVGNKALADLVLS